MPLGSLDVGGFGLGTLSNDDPEQCSQSVQDAIDIGYRHIDTGQMYGNEESVGAGIAAASVRREQLFVGTKILHPSITDEATPDEVVRNGRLSLEKLGLDQVDLLYFHWPDDFDLEDAFEGFDRLAAEGAYEHLGVSNFTPALLDEARDLASEPIEVLQVECHPLLQQEELRAYCEANDMTMVAYAPVLRGGAEEVPELVDIADRHDATPSQVSLAWVQAKGVVPIPKATSRGHIQENWDAQELELDDEDIATIDAIDREERLVDPGHGPWNW